MTSLALCIKDKKSTKSLPVHRYTSCTLQSNLERMFFASCCFDIYACRSYALERIRVAVLCPILSTLPFALELGLPCAFGRRA